MDGSFNLTTGQAVFPGAGITEQLIGFENLTGSWGNNTITGDSGSNILDGFSGDDTVYGGGGNDTIIGGDGDDVLDGGTGGDTYRFGSGSGQDVVVNSNDAGTTDRILFDEAVTRDLWFHQVGNDLQVTVIGSGDHLLVDDWFLGTPNQVDRFETADGYYLEASQVEQLRNAMAAFDPPVGEGASLSQATEEVILPVVASTWQEQSSA